MPTIAEAGFKVVINNRPDAEIGQDLCCDEMRAAAAAAGLEYIANPVVNGALGAAQVLAQKEVLDDKQGPVLAYCRSGTRSAIVWAMANAEQMPAEELAAKLSKAGYDIPGIEGHIAAIKSSGLLSS